MGFSKKCKVRLVPTYGSTVPAIYKNGDSMHPCKRIYTSEEHREVGLVPYNVYIVADEDIKSNDLVQSVHFGVGIVIDGNFRNFRGNFPLRVEYLNGTTSPYNIDGSYTNDNKKIYEQDCYKVISTTEIRFLSEGTIDNTVDTGSVIEHTKYARPSNKFIKAYCSKGGIDNVLVEYTGYNDSDTGIEYRLKVDSHNTITIKPVEEKMYSREEVEKLYRQGRIEAYTQTKAGFLLEEISELSDEVLKNL